VEPHTTAVDGELETAIDAYVYLYPLVLMEMTRRQMTNYTAPRDQPPGAPSNQIAHARTLADASLKVVVTPNIDTLYSIAWLDLAREPVLLSLPETRRYHVFQLLDMWTDVFASIGTRTTGNDSRTFAIVGPEWIGGGLPDGVEPIRSPTRYAWIIGRTQTNGASDERAVHGFQDLVTLEPLSGQHPAPEIDPAIDMKTPPPEQVARLEPARFFELASHLLLFNAPHAGDQPILSRIQRLGLEPGGSFVPSAHGDLLERAVKDAQRLIKQKSARRGESAHHWTFKTEDVGAYGSDYLERAAIAMVGLGANLPTDAVYPMARVDADGQPLDGRERYRIHFDREALPPARAFWSVTLYGADHFLYDNPLKRYGLGDRDPLAFNTDGSMDLYIQHESPGFDLETNWIPAPLAPFTVVMRLYWPAPSVLSGGWQPPPIERLPAPTVH
jgi:hypothetical protein